MPSRSSDPRFRGETELHLGAVAGRAPHLDAAAELLDPSFHAAEDAELSLRPQRRLVVLEADAVVADRDRDGAVLLLRVEGDARSGRVVRHVLQRLPDGERKSVDL